MPNLPDDLRQLLQSMDRRLTTLEGTARKRPALTTVDGDLIVTGMIRSPDFDGTSPEDPGTVGMGLTGLGAVFNEAFFRQGIIGDDALANPIGVASATPNVQTGWATTSVFVDKASTSLTVPAGFTRALVFGFGTVVFQDSSPNRFDSRIQINNVNGPAVRNLANLIDNTSVFHSAVMTVAGGDVITLDVQVFTAAASSGFAANQAQVGGFAIFTRP